LKSTPNTRFAHAERGLTFLYLEKRDEARKDFKKSLEQVGLQTLISLRVLEGFAPKVGRLSDFMVK
jgi:hypothetical protein